MRAKVKWELFVVYDPQHISKWLDLITRPEGVDFPAVVIGDRLFFNFFMANSITLKWAHALFTRSTTTIADRFQQ